MRHIFCIGSASKLISMKSIPLRQIVMFLWSPCQLPDTPVRSWRSTGTIPPLMITTSPKRISTNTFMSVEHAHAPFAWSRWRQNPNAWSARLVQVGFVGNEILVLQKNKLRTASWFSTKTVQFLRCIGIKGKGPGEYGVLRTFSVEPVTHRIYLIDPYQQNILIFNLFGKFIRNIHRDVMFSGPLTCWIPTVSW